MYRLYFQICRCSLSPCSAQFCTSALHQVPGRFICPLACGVSCPCVSCMNNSWRSKAFAENNHEQLLAQILPSVLYPVPITITAPKLPRGVGVHTNIWRAVNCTVLWKAGRALGWFFMATFCLQEQVPVPVYHPTPSQTRLATQLTEEEQIRIAQRIGLIQHLPKGVYDPGRDGSEKKIRE